MSNYQDIYRDLPSRVCQVWQRTKMHPDNETEDLSVTAMLMAAAAGLAMPLESLKDVGIGNRNDWNSHPAFGTAEQSEYKAALERCNKFFSQLIVRCESLQDIVLMRCQELCNIREAAEGGQGGTPLDRAKSNVRFVTKILRNALAHNNILAFGKSRNQIENLVFFSENRTGSGCKNTVDGWHVLTISVKSFEEFLNAWFDLLKGQDSFVGAAMALAGEDNDLTD